MYPRNAASPERIGVGAVVQISDGAVQTSGVSISVRGQAGASGAGGGTTAYDNGIVEYTPTQAETDFTSFVVVAYKTGCIPVAQTIVTSASATPGHAGTDQSKIANPTATVGLSGTTVGVVSALTGHTAQTGDSYAIVNSGTHGNSALKTLIDALEADLVIIDNFVDDLEGRLTAARAGYLDNLSVGAVALEASVQSVLTKLLKYVQLLTRKDAAIATDNATELTAINADGGSGGGAYSNQTDALEALQAEHDATQAALVTIDDFLDTEIAAILEDTGTTLQGELDGIQADTEDIQARLPAALTADGNIKADSLRISGSATAADNLEASALGIVSSAVNDASATTTSFVTDLTEATDDHYNGRIIVFTSGAVAGQATDITDYNGTTKAVTVTALTEAPADNVTFVIV